MYTFPIFGNHKYKERTMIYNKALKASRLFGNVKTTGVATLANANFPLINRVFDISADGLTIWAMKDFEIANHDISMDILVYNAQTSSECFMYDVRARLKTKKAVPELQSMSTVWHLNFEFVEMAILNGKNLTSFLEKEGKYSCLLDGSNTFSDFVR